MDGSTGLQTGEALGRVRASLQAYLSSSVPILKTLRVGDLLLETVRSESAEGDGRTAIYGRKSLENGHDSELGWQGIAGLSAACGGVYERGFFVSRLNFVLRGHLLGVKGFGKEVNSHCSVLFCFDDEARKPRDKPRRRRAVPPSVSM